MRRTDWGRLWWTLLRAESRLGSRRVWAVALAGVAAAQAVYYAPAVGANWMASGTDMRVLLSAARSATAADVAGWLTGPWIGRSLFCYYRPVTSLALYAEYRLFGESSAGWQVVSLLLHICTTLLLALLARRIFGSAVAGLAAAVVWGWRDRMALAIAWTPAQTDLLAGLWAVGALLALRVHLDERRPAALPAAALMGLLALGSKEVALTLPLLAAPVAALGRAAGRRERTRILVGACLLGAAFFAWRTLALRGLGFVPGQPVHGGPPHPFSLAETGQHLIYFLVPEPLAPDAWVPPAATLVAVAGIVWAWSFARRGEARVAWVVACGTLVAVSLRIRWESWLGPEIYREMPTALAAAAVVLVAVYVRPQHCVLTLVYGALAWLPLYHVVFNAAGNVLYLPSTYWGLAWGCAAAGAVDLARSGAGTQAVVEGIAPEPEQEPPPAQAGPPYPAARNSP